MKICYIFSTIDKSNFTGQPAVGLMLLKKAQKAKHQVSLISNYSEEIKDINLMNINHLLIKGTSTLRTYISKTISIIKFLKKTDPDIIHIKGIPIIIFFWLLNRLFFHKLIICSIYETPERYKYYLRKLLSYCLNRSQVTFTSSEYIKEILLNNGTSKEKIIVKYTGLKQSFKDKLNNYSRYDTDIIFYGDSIKERGFDIVYKLARILKDCKFKILIRWKGDNCQFELREMEKLPNVTILYYPYSEKLEDILIRGKIIVLPFRYMNMRPPISIIESMVLGKCVITSNMKGNKEVIQNKKNGFIVNFNNLINVASNISHILKDNNLIKKIGINAKKAINNKYSTLEYSKIFEYYSLTKNDKFYENEMFGNIGGQYVSDVEKKALITQLEPNKKDNILDIGTGSGRFARFIVRNTAAKVFGVDPDREMLKEGKTLRKIFLSSEESKRYKCFLSDGHNLPFRNNRFDKIYCFRVLKYFKNPQKGIDEMFRVLKPGGVLVLEITNIYSWESLMRLLLSGRNKKADHSYYWTKNSIMFDPKAVKKYLSKIGLLLIEEKSLHKIPPRIYTILNSQIANHILSLLSAILLVITPKYLLSKSIIFKCKKIN